MKRTNLFLMGLMTLMMICFTACESNNNMFDADYAKDIIGTWVYENDTIFDRMEIYADGTYGKAISNSKTKEYYSEDGTWTVKKNELVFVSSESKNSLRTTIEVLAPKVMVVLTDKTTKNTKSYRYVETDFPDKLVGTWTCAEANYAEALIIEKDGSFVATGVSGDKYWEGRKGYISRNNESYSYYYEDANYVFGNCKIVLGQMIQFLDFDGNTHLYKLCTKDFSKQIVGMWVYNNGTVKGTNDKAIMTFTEDGKLTYTGFSPMRDDFILNSENKYKVIGDLVLTNLLTSDITYTASRIVINNNATSLGDIMTSYIYPQGETEATPTSFLRVKQTLNLPTGKYNYSATYVTNANGKDEEITMMGYSFNISKMNGSNLDKMLNHLLFSVEFPTTDTIQYQYIYNNQTLVFKAPIVVDGNKVTIKMSEFSPYYRDVDMYMFQDAKNSQLHMYMPKYAFVNYFANMDLAALVTEGKIDLTDSAAVEKRFTDMDARVKSINLSIVMKASK